MCFGERDNMIIVVAEILDKNQPSFWHVSLSFKINREGEQAQELKWCAPRWGHTVKALKELSFVISPARIVL